MRIKWLHLGLCLAVLLGVLQLVPGRSGAASPAPATAPQIAAGYYYSLSLISDGTVWAWGINDHGSFGDGTTGSRNYPTAAKISDVRTIATGVRDGFAIKNDGTVWAWGQNNNGQLGDGTTTDRTSPVPVTAVNGIVALSGGIGYHTLALKSDGTVWAWGKNGNGELGNGTVTAQETSPVQTLGLTDVIAVSAGGYHSLALKSDGTVWAWGYGKDGELGNGTTTEWQSEPVQVSGLADVVAIAAGNYHNLAIKKDGTVWAWGNNGEGRLGDGTTTNRTTPVQVHGLSNIVQVAAGGEHSLALDADGNVWAWGNNGRVQLGDGTSVNQAEPIEVPGLADVAQIAAGAYHSLAMTEDGSVWAWGYNNGGQLGNGGRENQSTPYKSSAKTDYAPPDAGEGAIAAASATSTSITLSWAQATDNLTSRDGLQYMAYMSDTADIPTAGAIERGTPLGSPVSDGDSVTATATGLQPGTTYYFNVLVTDKAGNKSVYAMQALGTKPVFWVLYDGNGATEGSVPVDAAVYEEGGTAVALGNEGGLRKPGFSFAGWNTAADGTGMSFVAGDAVPIGSSDVTLYADWAEDAPPPVDPPTEPPVDPGQPPAEPPADPGVPSEPNPPLAGLTLSAGELSPLFDPLTTRYEVRVANEVSSLRLTPTAAGDDVSIVASVYGPSGDVQTGPVPLASGAESEEFALAVGTNRIEVRAGAEGSADAVTYTIEATREEAPASPPEEPPVVPPYTPSVVRTDNPPSQPAGYPILVNGRSLAQIAQAAEKNEDGRRTLTVTLKADGLTGLEAPSRLVIPVTESVDGVKVELPGAWIQALSANEADVEVRTPNGNYTLPSAEIGADRLMAMFGGQVPLTDISLTVGIQNGSEADAERLQAEGATRAFAVLAPPVEFSVTASGGGRTLPIERFDSFVRREIPLPDGIDRGSVATAVVLNDDGTVRQVPTSVETLDGRAYAVIRSMTNSSYALISRTASFEDTQGHWASSAVNDLASRLILNGADDNRFLPDSGVTRAEFASILVRALGLPGTDVQGRFRDVPADAWYAREAAQASELGIVQGYADGTFRPAAAVTREEAVAMIGRAMAIAGIPAEANEADPSRTLAAFADGSGVSEWARPAWAAAIREGVIAGEAGELRPHDKVTRAQTAVMVERLLTSAGFIGDSGCSGS